MGEQNTGDTDQTDTGFILHKERPQRAQEIAQAKRLKVFFFAWLALSTVAMLAGLRLVDRFLPDPIELVLSVLWVISIWGQSFGWGKMLKRGRIESDHYWQDAIDGIAIAIRDESERFVETQKAFTQETQTKAEELIAKEEKYHAEVMAQIDRIMGTSERRGPGRRPLTEQEIAHELERADRAAAEIEAQGRTPTQQEIAQRLGIAPKTLQRYRGRMDNKGQK